MLSKIHKLKEQTFTNLQKTCGEKTLPLLFEENILPVSKRPLFEIITDFRITNPNITIALTDEDIDKINIQFLAIEEIEKEIIKLPEIYLHERLEKIKVNFKNEIFINEDSFFILAAARLITLKLYHIYPHSSQILTVLALINNKTCFKGALAEVKTGEGKSIIISILALYFAFKNKTIDIIMSTESLAIQNQNHFKIFFNYFGFLTGHICESHPPIEKFNLQILYGTNTDFEFSILRDISGHSSSKTIETPYLKNREFQIVLVDEIDNLLIDKAKNTAIIAKKSTTCNHLIYKVIFQVLTSYVNIINIPKFDILIIEICNALNLNYEIKNAIEKIPIKIIKIYIKNAINAIWNLEIKIDYIMTKLINGENSIVIIDKITGYPCPGSRWENGLHEFIELKHGIILNEESNAVASISHPVFFNLYQEIYGLTGTIGSKSDINEIESIYQLNCFQVPTFLPPLNVILEPIVCQTEENFNKVVLKEILAMQKQGRPTLVLSNSIQDLSNLKIYFKNNNIKFRSITGNQFFSEEYILNQAGQPTSVILATNTASRGTDIILNSTSIKNGGLHVILTHFPQSQREEIQAMGRAARQGQPGSCRMILPPNDIGLRALPSNLKLTEIYGELLKKRISINIEQSSERKLYSKIERINFDIINKFFQACYEFNKLISNSFYEINLKKIFSWDEFLELKENCLNEIETQWIQNFQNFKIEYSSKKDLEKDPINIYQTKILNFFEHFKNNNELFFNKPESYFLTFIT